MEKLIVSVVFWLIAAVIVGSVIYSFLTRYFRLSWTSANPLARAGRAITRASWKRVTLFILLAPIGLLVLAATISFYRWIGPIALDTLYESVTDRPLFARSEQREARALPQGKSVGGPLRWSDNAKVNLRRRVTTEKSWDGRYFVGHTPPGSWTDFRFFSLAEKNPSSYYLVSNPEPSEISSETLLQRSATREYKVSGSVFHLAALSNAGQEELRMKNVSGLQQGSPTMSGYYVQQLNRHEHLSVERIDPSDTFQYELEVGSDMVQILELPKSFKWLWIAPVHHGCYESYFLDKRVPAAGISYEEALAAVQASEPVLQEYLQLPAKRFREDFRFQAILLERDGQTSVLSEALLLQQSNVSGSTMAIRLNIPSDDAIARVIKPAKIIVGVQL